MSDPNPRFMTITPGHSSGNKAAAEGCASALWATRSGLIGKHACFIDETRSGGFVLVGLPASATRIRSKPTAWSGDDDEKYDPAPQDEYALICCSNEDSCSSTDAVPVTRHVIVGMVDRLDADDFFSNRRDWEIVA